MKKSKKDFIVGMPKSEKVEGFHKKDLEDTASTHDMVSKNTARGDVKK